MYEINIKKLIKFSLSYYVVLLRCLTTLSYYVEKKMSNNSYVECPICMDDIVLGNNCVTTDCGHTFHCSCLLTNAAHNGFGCPYCRKELAEEIIDDDSEDDDEDEDYLEEEPFYDHPLTSFRMFHQRLNDEEVEEEEEEEEELLEDLEDETQDLPNAAYIGRKLEQRGINYDQLVKSLLYLEHTITLRGRPYGNDYERTSMEVYGQIRSVLHGYIRRQQNSNQVIR